MMGQGIAARHSNQIGYRLRSIPFAQEHV